MMVQGREGDAVRVDRGRRTRRLDAAIDVLGEAIDVERK